MITKEQYIESLVQELAIIKHLAAKITPDMLAYRPHEKQRTMLELLQYMGQYISTGVTGQIAGDQNVYIELMKTKDAVTFENFAEKIDEQIRVVQEKVSALTDADFAREATVFGNTATLAVRLLGVLKNASAYKMQLFLYIKATGNHDIGTSNLWAGQDVPPKE